MINLDTASYPQEYKVDIYEQLKKLEKERFIFQNRSPQSEYRYALIKWMKKLFGKVEFCRITLHLSVYLLDFFMDSHSIKPEKLTLIASICFVLAGKFEERDAKIPRISEINSILNSSYSRKDFLYLENVVLKYFKWKLTIPTASHFAEYFLDFAVVREDICENCSNYNYVFNVVRGAVNEMLDLTLEDNTLMKESPSFIAASCILAVRKTYNLNPFWPVLLQNIATYSESDLMDCAAHIISFKEKHQNQRKRKLEQSPDQGYETEKGSPSTPKTRKY